MVKLFEIEVPEITNKRLKLYSAARDQGSRSEIAVKALDKLSGSDWCLCWNAWC